MQSIIEDLYFCRHKNSETIKMNEEYWENSKIEGKIFEELETLLGKEKRRLLDDLFFAHAGCESVQATVNFMEGFKLGMRLAIESMY